MEHSASAFQQRVLNGQPGGGLVAEGTGPVSTMRSVVSSRLGVAESNASVYGCLGAPATSAARPSSTMRPR